MPKSRTTKADYAAPSPNEHRVAKTPALRTPLSPHREEEIARCLAGLDLCLHRENREECHAWIDRHFNSTEPSLTWQSNVAELPIPTRLANYLQGAGVETVLDLQAAIRTGKIYLIPNVGPVQVDQCERAIEGIGRTVVDWVI